MRQKTDEAGRGSSCGSGPRVPQATFVHLGKEREETKIRVVVCPYPTSLLVPQWGSTRPPSLGPCSCSAFSPARSLATSWTGGSRTVWTPPLMALPPVMPGDSPTSMEPGLFTSCVPFPLPPCCVLPSCRRTCLFTDEEMSKEGTRAIVQWIVHCLACGLPGFEPQLPILVCPPPRLPAVILEHHRMCPLKSFKINKSGARVIAQRRGCLPCMH